MSGARRWIALAIAAGLGLRLAFGLGYWTDKPLTHDEREYLALARSLALGEGFTYPPDAPAEGTAPRFGRAPGYPVFLALLHVAAPAEHVPVRVKVAQSIVAAAGIWLIALIAWRCGGPPAGVAAAGIAAIHPPLVWMPAYALSETLYSALALAGALALTPAAGTRRAEGGSARPPAARSIVAAAVLIAAAILVRPAMLFVVPLAALWLWRERFGAALVFVLVISACVAPWTLRNHRVYGRWIAVASEGGVTFWTGNHPLARGEGDLAANPELKRAEIEFRRAHAGLTPEELEPLYYRDAIAWIAGHPLDWLALEARKAFYTVVPLGPSYTLHSARYSLASIGAYLLILPAALVGAFSARRAGAQAPAALWLMAGATVMAGLVFFPQERFRVPVIDPALIVSAAMLAALPAHERTGRLPDV